MFIKSPISNNLSFPDDSVVKNPPANAGDAGLIPVLGRSPGGGNGNPLQFSWEIVIAERIEVQFLE